MSNASIISTIVIIARSNSRSSKLHYLLLTMSRERARGSEPTQPVGAVTHSGLVRPSTSVLIHTHELDLHRNSTAIAS